MPTYSDHEKDYLFDLQGFLILDNALNTSQLNQVNAWIDDQEDVPNGTWLGNVETHTYSGNEGVNYQHIIEGGPVFEELITNPAWIADVRRWMVGDYNSITLNETFINVRRSGGFIGLHSGGQVNAPIMTFRNPYNGSWNVGQINILVALDDIGPGDGATVVVPSSHKSAILHPELTGVDESAGNTTYRSDRDAGQVLAGQEVHLKKGQAVMFTDSISHGANSRVNPGERRVLIYRYSPHSIMNRYNYVPSPELMERLSPEAQKIVQPLAPRMAPGRQLAGAL